jgi:hypothetical protein
MYFCLVANLALINIIDRGFLQSVGWPAWLGIMGYALLVFLPGAWISFGFPVKGIAFWTRLCLSIVLSPLIVGAEFYAVRLLGVSFPSTAVFLVFLNLPAAYLVWRRRGPLASAQRGNWLVGSLAVAVPIACLGSMLAHMDARIYSGHSWLHADAVNMLIRGDLVPEDPTLAGVRMSYPVWTGLPFEAVHSYLTNSPAQCTYIWSNLFLLMIVCGFASGIARELGGGRAAQASSAVLLLLGTNPVGYLLMKLVPPRGNQLLWGDERYTPWVSKFMLFSPMALGLAITMAILYLLVRPGPLTRDVFVMLTLLACGLGLFYPLLFPSACGILCARALADVTEKPGWNWKTPGREVLTLAGLVLLASLMTYAEVRFLTSARQASAAPVLLSKLPSAMRKAFAAAVSTSLLLTGAALTVRHLLRLQRRSTVVLLAGAAASYLLYAAFVIPYYENEYKFVFPVAMCLFVFPAIAAERIWREWPRARAVPALALSGLLLMGTYAYWTYRNWPAPWLGARPTSKSYPQTYDPPLDANGLYLRLNEQYKLSGICNAVRSMTPVLSVLLVDNSAIYYPGLTNRSLYVPAENRSYPGVNLWADALDMNVRGYGPQILAERRAVLSEFFEAKDSSLRENALQAVQGLKRPIAVIADSAHPDLLNWLKADKAANELYAENDLSLWLIDEPDSRR